MESELGLEGDPKRIPVLTGSMNYSSSSSENEQEERGSEEDEDRDLNRGEDPLERKSLLEFRIPKMTNFPNATRYLPPPPPIPVKTTRRRVTLPEDLQRDFEETAAWSYTPFSERESLLAPVPLIASVLSLAPTIDDSLRSRANPTIRLPVHDMVLTALDEMALSSLNCIALTMQLRELSLAARFSSILHQDLVAMRRERVLKEKGSPPGWSMDDVRPPLFGSDLLTEIRTLSPDNDFMKAMDSLSAIRSKPQRQKPFSKAPEYRKANNKKRPASKEKYSRDGIHKKKYPSNEAPTAGKMKAKK